MVKVSRKGKTALRKFYKGVMTDAKQTKEIKKLKTQVKKLSKADEKKWYDISIINSHSNFR